MSVTNAAAAPIVPIQRAQSQPLMVMDDGHMVPGGPSDRSGDDKFKFSDLVALVNPLQHLPVIGPLYRKLTGDEPHPAVKVVGGLLFGGPIGLVNATLNHVFEQTTGKTMVEAVARLFTSEGEKPAVADAAQPENSPGAPRRLIPAVTLPTPEPAATTVPTAARAPAAAGATPTPALAAATPTATSTQAPASAPNNATPIAVRQAGARDLAWYQVNAGARLPATLNGSTATGSQGPSVPRSVGPSYIQGSTPAAQVGATTSPLATPPMSAAEFLNRAATAQQRYTALMQQAARGNAAIDRFE